MNNLMQQAIFRNLRQQQTNQAFMAAYQEPKEVTLKVSFDTETPPPDGAEKFWITKDGIEELGVFDKEYKFPQGTIVTLRALQETVTYFTKWNDGNLENPRVVILNEDTNLTAIFHTNRS